MGEMVKEKSGNLRKMMKVRKKSGNFDRLSERKSFTTPQIQIDDFCFCPIAVSKNHGIFS